MEGSSVTLLMTSKASINSSSNASLTILSFLLASTPITLSHDSGKVTHPLHVPWMLCLQIERPCDTWHVHDHWENIRGCQWTHSAHPMEDVLWKYLRPANLIKTNKRNISVVPCLDWSSGVFILTSLLSSVAGSCPFLISPQRQWVENRGYFLLPTYSGKVRYHDTFFSLICPQMPRYVPRTLWGVSLYLKW